MVFNVAKIVSACASSTISLTKLLRVAGPLAGADMVPKDNGFNQSETTSCCARAHCEVSQAGLPWQGMAKLYKGSIFFTTETQFAIQSQVT